MTDRPDFVHDTIVAAATPPGTGGIAIVRVSGEETGDIARKLLGSVPPPRIATLTNFRNGEGEVIDSGIALYFPAPNSFTGESILELQGHGGPVVVSMLIDAVTALGARRAEPGEFSKRAFLNERLDLVQAEAIADLITSGTSQAARAALRSLSGEFSKAIESLQLQLTNLRLHVEAAIDFPEEEIDFLSDKALLQRIEECAAAFARLNSQASIGRVLRDGFQVVIVGRPNVGKSSLLNYLSGQDAAIVTEIAGTTRDVLRERIDIDGLAVELIDTAGLRHDPDRIEAEGIRRARDALTQADAILWVQDASAAVDDSVDDLEDQLPEGVPITVVRNKIDLSGELPGRHRGDDQAIYISASEGAGIDQLRAEIRTLAGYKDQGEGAFTARRRHVEALLDAEKHFELGRAALLVEKAGELMAEELRLAQQSMGEITGTFTSDDLLGKIFSEFCIGK